MFGPASKETAWNCLVIGYGSLLRRDDAAGRHVAEAVAAWNLTGVRALDVHQLTPELAEPLAEADLAIFVDAAMDGDGSITTRPLDLELVIGSLGHACDPSYLLTLAHRLYGHAPRAWLLGIPAPDLGLGEGLSPVARQGVARALDWIARLLNPPGGPACTRSA